MNVSESILRSTLCDVRNFDKDDSPVGHCYAILNDGKLIATYISQEDKSDIWFAIWSAENGQDDLVFTHGVKGEDGEWTYALDIDAEKKLKSPYVIHVYEGTSSNPETYLCDYITPRLY